MSELLHRAIDDLDGRAPGGFQDARQRLLEEVRQGADGRQLAATVNQIEMQPGHAHVQIATGVDNRGYLDFVPVNGYGDNQGPPPPPQYDAPPPQYRQGPTPGEVGAVLGAGILGAVIGGVLLHGQRRPEPPRYYNRGY